MTLNESTPTLWEGIEETKPAPSLWERRKQQGLCPRCGEPPDDPDQLQCSACRKKVNQGVKIIRRNRKKAGLCVQCGKVAVGETESYCPTCCKQFGVYNARRKRA